MHAWLSFICTLAVTKLELLLEILNVAIREKLIMSFANKAKVKSWQPLHGNQTRSSGSINCKCFGH